MDEEYSFYEEDINKNHIIKYVVIFGIILLIGGGYFVYQKYVTNQDKKEVTNEVSVTDRDIQEVYHTYNLFTTAVNDFSLYLQNDLFGYYYREELYSNKTISNEVKLITAIHQLFLNETILYQEESTEPWQVDGKIVREMVTTLFGEDATYHDTSLDEEEAAFCQFGVLKYNEEKDVYETSGEMNCAGSNRPLIKTKLLKAEKTDSEMIITEEMAYLVPDRDENNQVIYSVYDQMETTKENLIDHVSTQSEFAFYNYKRLHQYQYHFKKQGKQFILVQIERIK